MDIALRLRAFFLGSSRRSAALGICLVLVTGTLAALPQPAEAHDGGRTGVFLSLSSANGVSFGNPSAAMTGDGYLWYDVTGSGCATRDFTVSVWLRPLDDHGGAIGPFVDVDGFFLRKDTCNVNRHEITQVWPPWVKTAPQFEVAFVVNDGYLLRARTFGSCLQTSPTERVSVDSDGRESAGEGWFREPSISAGGRYVAFGGSFRYGPLGFNNGILTPGATGIHLRDRETNTTQVVSVASGGEPANAHSSAPSISYDGRFVAFASWASNLAAGHASGWNQQDIFLRDRVSETTSLVSRSWDGSETNGPSWHPQVSGDGMSVVFTSWANNLVENDDNNEWDVFVYRVASQTVERVSASAGGPESGGAGRGSISDSGRFVAFSTRHALVTSDRNGFEDVYVRDTQTGALKLIGPGTDADISGNARYVAMERRRLTDNVKTVVVFDRQTGRSVTASTNAAGESANANSSSASITHSGRYVAFESMADNLVPGDEDEGPWGELERMDSFVKDLRTGEVTAFDGARNGEPMTRWGQPFGARAPDISPDGQVLAFDSLANNVVCDDDNLTNDVFVTPASGGDDLGPGDLGATELDYVALGDSYSSGEGIYPFLEGDAYDQPCHRSTKAWPFFVRAPGSSEPIASPEAPGELDFKACASAVISNIATKAQTPEGVEVPLQLEHVNPSTDLISMTIGGNDAEFADILIFCAKHLDCADDTFRPIDDGPSLTLREWATSRMTDLENELVEVYRQIDEKTEGNAAIVVATYPHLFSESDHRLTGCPEQIIFGPGEREWINSASDDLQETIMRAGFWAGASVAPVIEHFRGHEVCSELVAGDEWIAGIDAAWKVWSPNAASFHPTEKGAVAYADVVSETLAARESAFSARRAAGTTTARHVKPSRIRKLTRLAATEDGLTPEEGIAAAKLELDPLGLMSLAALTGDTSCDGIAVPRQQLVAYGHGFEPGSAVSVSFAGEKAGELKMGTITADDNGDVVVSAALPAAMPDAIAGFEAVGRSPGNGLRILSGIFETAAPTSECGQLARDTGQLSVGGAPAPAAGWMPGLDGRVLTVSPRSQLELAATMLENGQPDATPNDARWIGMALSDVRRALTARLWDGDRLTAAGAQVFEDVRVALMNLSKTSALPDVARDVPSILVDAVLDIAVREVDRAWEAGANMTRAEGHLARGDELAAQGAVLAALNEYKLAWGAAARSRS